MLAAGGEHDRAGVELDSGRDRLVGGGVAGVQADEQVDRLLACACVLEDRGGLEARALVAELGRDRPDALDDLGIGVDAHELDLAPATLRVQVEREAHVRLAAARVDDPERPGPRPQRQRAQELDVVLYLALLVGARSGRREQACHLGVSGRERVGRGAIVRGQAGTGSRERGLAARHEPAALLRAARVPVAARADHVDAEELLVEERAELERPVGQRDVSGLLAAADGLHQLHGGAALERRPAPRRACRARAGGRRPSSTSRAARGRRAPRRAAPVPSRAWPRPP